MYCSYSVYARMEVSEILYSFALLLRVVAKAKMKYYIMILTLAMVI